MKSNPPEVAADPDGAGAGVRRHQALLGRAQRQAGTSRQRQPAHARRDEGAGHRRRHAARYRRHAGGPGQAVAQRAADGTQRQQEPEDRERAHASEGKRDRPTHPVRARRRARPPATGPRAVGRRPPADPGPAARPATAPGRPLRQERPGRPAGGPRAGGRRRQELRRQPGRQCAQHQRHALGRAGRCEALGEEWQQRRPELPDQLRAGAEDAFRHGRRRGKHRRGCGQPRRGRVGQAGLHGAVELDADGLDRDDRADRPRADRRHGQRPVSLQGADRPRQPHRQRHRHPRRGRRGGQRHGLGRLDAFLRARPDPLGHVRLQRRHDPHRAGGRQSESEQRQSGQQREQHDAGWPGLDQRPLRHPVRLGRAAQQRAAVPVRRR